MGLGLKGNGPWTDPDARYIVPTAAVIIALLGLYASTLCRQFLQALGAAIGIGALAIFLTTWLYRPAMVGGYPLWEGAIGAMVAGGVALLFAFGLISWRGRWRLFLAAC